MYFSNIAFAILFIFMLFGCSQAEENILKYPDYPKLQERQIEDAIAKFNREYPDYEIIDYVAVNDEHIPGLKTVISFYDKKENNSCNLAFGYEDAFYTINFAVNEIDGVKTFEIADDSRLTYVGDGTVATSIRKIATNEILDYNVKFSMEDFGVNYEIASDKRIK